MCFYCCRLFEGPVVIDDTTVDTTETVETTVVEGTHSVVFSYQSIS